MVQEVESSIIVLKASDISIVSALPSASSQGFKGAAEARVGTFLGFVASFSTSVGSFTLPGSARLLDPLCPSTLFMQPPSLTAFCFGPVIVLNALWMTLKVKHPDTISMRGTKTQTKEVCEFPLISSIGHKSVAKTPDDKRLKEFMKGERRLWERGRLAEGEVPGGG